MRGEQHPGQAKQLKTYGAGTGTDPDRCQPRRVGIAPDRVDVASLRVWLSHQEQKMATQ